MHTGSVDVTFEVFERNCVAKSSDVVKHAIKEVAQQRETVGRCLKRVEVCTDINPGADAMSVGEECF